MLCGGSGDFGGSEATREVTKAKGIIKVPKVLVSGGYKVDLHYIMKPGSFLAFFEYPNARSSGWRSDLPRLVGTL